MSGETQIVTLLPDVGTSTGPTHVAADGTHHPGVPPFHLATGRTPGAGDPIRQNRPSLPAVYRAKQSQFAVTRMSVNRLPDKELRKEARITAPEKQSQFASRVCSVPVRASKEVSSLKCQVSSGKSQASTRQVFKLHTSCETPHGITTSGARCAKQSQSSGGPLDAKCWEGKGLWDKIGITPVRKTKPICLGGPAPAAANPTCAVWRAFRHATPSHTASGRGTILVASWGRDVLFVAPEKGCVCEPREIRLCDFCVSLVGSPAGPQ